MSNLETKNDEFINILETIISIDNINILIDKSILNNKTKQQIKQKNINKSNESSYKKIMEIIDKPAFNDTDIFKKGVKYILKFDSKPSKIYHIS